VDEEGSGSGWESGEGVPAVSSDVCGSPTSHRDFSHLQPLRRQRPLAHRTNESEEQIRTSEPDLRLLKKFSENNSL
jgi:hypothetical protein